MIASAIFSIAMLVIFGALLVKRFRWWTNDRRAGRRQTQRELIEAVLLFLVAFGTALASAAYYIDPRGADHTALAVGIGMSWGAILGTGIVMLTEPNPANIRR